MGSLDDAVQTKERPFSDSPWFWAYLFAVAALIGLALIGPKYSERQAQMERQFEGRQGPSASAKLRHADDAPPRITLQPLYFGLAAATIVVWLLHWQRRKPSYAARVHPSGPGDPSAAR